MKHFGVNQQQALLILSGNTEFYANNNQRLSVNIATTDTEKLSKK